MIPESVWLAQAPIVVTVKLKFVGAAIANEGLPSIVSWRVVAL